MDFFEGGQRSLEPPTELDSVDVVHMHTRQPRALDSHPTMATAPTDKKRVRRMPAVTRRLAAD